MVDARPIHRVRVKGFWMDTHEVTNAEFAAFVEATDHVDRGRTAASARGLSRRIRPKISWRARSYLPRRRPPCRCGLAPGPPTSGGGPTCPVPAGGTRSAPTVPSRAATTNRWSTSPTRMPRPTPPGRASGCPPRPSGSLPPGAASTGEPYPWGDELRPDGTWMANIWQGRFPLDEHRRRRLRRNRPSRPIPAQRLRSVRHVGERLGVVQRLVPP